MLCPQCGRYLNEQASLCRGCGRVIDPALKDGPSERSSSGWTQVHERHHPNIEPIEPITITGVDDIDLSEETTDPLGDGSEPAPPVYNLDETARTEPSRGPAQLSAFDELPPIPPTVPDTTPNDAAPAHPEPDAGFALSSIVRRDPGEDLERARTVSTAAVVPADLRTWKPPDEGKSSTEPVVPATAKVASPPRVMAARAPRPKDLAATESVRAPEELRKPAGPAVGAPPAKPDDLDDLVDAATLIKKRPDIG